MKKKSSCNLNAKLESGSKLPEQVHGKFRDVNWMTSKGKLKKSLVNWRPDVTRTCAKGGKTTVQKSQRYDS